MGNLHQQPVPRCQKFFMYTRIVLPATGDPTPAASLARASWDCTIGPQRVSILSSISGNLPRVPRALTCIAVRLLVRCPKKYDLEHVLESRTCSGFCISLVDGQNYLRCFSSSFVFLDSERRTTITLSIKTPVSPSTTTASSNPLSRQTSCCS